MSALPPKADIDLGIPECLLCAISRHQPTGRFRRPLSAFLGVDLNVYDAGYWYNRNLVIIANIERQFLRRSDLHDIHYYFGKHRKTGALITHLEIQMWLAVAVAALVLTVHFATVVLPIWKNAKEGTGLTYLPWAATAAGLVAWWWSKRKAAKRYETFIKNSPGIPIDDAGITHGPGHPV